MLRTGAQILCAIAAGLYCFGEEMGQVHFAWDANKEANIAGYNFYYRETTPDAPAHKVNVGSRTFCTVSGLVRGKTYYFYVTAYNNALLESEPSTQITYLVPSPSGIINDDFAGATVIHTSSFPLSVTNDTTLATLEPDEMADCGPIDKTVWYRVVADAPTTVAVNALTTPFLTIVEAYAGTSFDDLEPLGCHADFFDTTNSFVTFALGTGESAYIQAGGFFGQSGLLTLNFLHAPPPTNDFFANAVSIHSSEFPGAISTSTAEAGTEANEPSGACAELGGTLWYKVTADAPMLIQADTFGSSFDTVLAAYTQPGTSITDLQPLTCNDDAGGAESRIGFSLGAGESAYLQVGGYFGATGSLLLNLQQYPKPANDDFLNAAALDSTNYPISVALDTRAATSEPSEPSDCAPAGNTVWYQLTTSTNMLVEVNTIGSTFDTVVAAYTGTSFGDLMALGLCDHSTNGNSRIRVPLTAGQTNYVQVGGYAGASGDLQVNVFELPRPGNDAFTNAISLTVTNLPFSTNMNTAAASIELDEPSACGSSGATVWYQVQSGPDGPATFEVNTFGSSFDTVLAAYTGTTLSGLTQIACNDDTLGSQSRIQFSLAAGASAYIQAGGHGGVSGDLSVSIREITQIPNDNFESALAISSSSLPLSFTNDTTQAAIEPGEPSACAPIGATLWYHFTAASDLLMEVNTFGSSYDTVLAAYSGSAIDGLTPLTCNDDTAGLQSRIVFSLTAGQSVFLQVGGYFGATGVLQLNLYQIVQPANDAFVNAIERDSNELPFSDRLDTRAASMEELEPGPAPASGTAWYHVTASSATAIQVNAASDWFLPFLAAYTGTALDNLVKIVDNTNTYAGRIVFQLAQGESVYIQVSGFFGGAGELEVEILNAPSVPNDSFANAIQLSSSDFPISRWMDTTLATLETGETNGCAQIGATIWYHLTADRAMMMSVDTVGSMFDAILGVYTETSLDNLAQIACSESANGGAIQFSLAEGQSVYIQAGGLLGANGGLVVNVDQVPFLTPPIILNFAVPPVVRTGVSMPLTADFLDPDPNDYHTAQILWGDGTSDVFDADEVNHRVTTDHIYGASGSYTVSMTLFDGAGNSDSSMLPVQVVSTTRFAGPFATNGTWNVYEYIPAAMSFIDAQAFATNSTYSGVPGHLVVLHSKGEDLEMRRMTQGASYWLGLTDLPLFGGVETSTGSPGLDRWHGWAGDLAVIPEEYQGQVRANGWVALDGGGYDYEDFAPDQPDNGWAGQGAVAHFNQHWIDAGSGTSGEKPWGFPAIIEYETQSPTNPAPSDPQVASMGAILPDPTLPGPEGGNGFIGVREYGDIGFTTSIEDAIDRIRNLTATDFIDGIAGVLSSQETNAVLTDELFRTNGVPFLSEAAENGQPFCAIYKARFKVPPGMGGDWSFRVSSHQAFLLRIQGAAFTNLLGAGFIDPFDASVCTYPESLPGGPTRVVANLAAGDYSLLFICSENSTGGFCELAAAPGDNPDDTDPAWKLLGVADSPLQFVSPDPLSTYHEISEDTTLDVPAPGVLATSPTGVIALLAHGAANGTVNLQPDGSFSYQPVADAFGLDSFTFQASDGVSTGAEVVVTLAVRSVNDPPSFTASMNTWSIPQDGGFQLVLDWAANISPGAANEANQTLWFTTTNDNPGLFSFPPTVLSSGLLLCAPALHARGAAAVTVQLHDNGGTANGGVDTSAPQTFLLTVGLPADSDGDGLPDDYELAFGLNPHDPADAAFDLDGDGLANLQEYLAGTDPSDFRSTLKITAFEAGASSATLHFTSIPGKSYSVEYNDDFPSGLWQAVPGSLPGTGMEIQQTDSATANAQIRIYRVKSSGLNGEVTNQAAGFCRFLIGSNSDTLLSIPFTRPAAELGVVLSISGSSVQTSGSGTWAAGQWTYAGASQSNTYSLLIRSGDREGEFYTITNNSTTDLMLDLSSDSLTGIAPGDAIAIIPYWTLGTIFPGGQGVHPSASPGNRATEILLPSVGASGINLATARTYYFHDGAWRQVGEGGAIKNDDILSPDIFFWARQNDPGSTTLTVQGAVLDTKLRLFLRRNGTMKQDNFVAVPRAGSFSLDDSGLFSDLLSDLFRDSLDSSDRTDELLVYSNSVAGKNKSASATYYHSNGAWRKVGAGASYNAGPEKIFTPGGGVVLRLSPAPSSGVWVDLPHY